MDPTADGRVRRSDEEIMKDMNERILDREDADTFDPIAFALDSVSDCDDSRIEELTYEYGRALQIVSNKLANEVMTNYEKFGISFSKFIRL